MRRCAIWVSPHVDRDTIVDTSTLDFSQPKAWWGRDTPPADTVLVIVHPRREMELRDAACTTFPPSASLWDFADVNRQTAAAAIISAHCRRDPELRRALRWT